MEPDGARKVFLGPEQAFGMVRGFTERPIPGDPARQLGRKSSS
jgi:hypothetical protein